MSHYVNDKCLRQDQTYQESVAGYGEMAPTFNQYLETINYQAHVKTGQLMDELFPNKDGVKVLDVACGTGLVAQELKAAGFTHFDGVDPSEGMIKESEKTGYYNKLVCAYMGVDDSKLPFDDNSYDAAMLIGGMGQNMMPCKGIHELVRCVKPGGYIINIHREAILTEVEEYKDRLEPLMDSLEKEGKWKRVSRTRYPEYQCDKVGIIHIHQVC